jgi:hypothetical protein
MKREQELPLSPQRAGDRVADAAGRSGWQVRARTPASLTLWKPARISQLQRAITVEVSLSELEPGRTRVRLEADAGAWRPLRRQLIESQLSELADAVGRRVRGQEAMPRQVERWLIRMLVAVLAIGALLCALEIGVPGKSAPAKTATATAAGAASPAATVAEGGEEDLPAVALDEVSVYRTEIGLGVFYVGLLILVPLFYGVVRGRIPTEISARGTRFAADEISGSLEAAEQKIEQVDQRLVEAEALIALTRTQQGRRAAGEETAAGDGAETGDEEAAEDRGKSGEVG